MDRFQHYIDGRFEDAAEVFDSIDPANGIPWARMPAASAADMCRAVEAADRAFADWAATTATARGKLLYRLADLVQEAAPRLAELETRDTGKIIRETSAQIAYVAEYYRYYAGLADKIEGAHLPIDKPDMEVWLRREPVGVVAAIVPWNSQLFLSAVKLGPALAAGCTVVLKASEDGPAPLLDFARLVDRAGFPAGVINILTGGPAAGKALTTHPKVAHIAFTGGPETARHIVRASAENLSKTSLELGGKSPFIVFEDADLDSAANAQVAGIFAATMSTADSLILSCSAAITHDLLPHNIERQSLIKLSTLLITLAALGLALANNQSVFSLVIMAWSGLASAFAPLLLALCLGWKPGQAISVLAVCSGLLVALLWRYAQLHTLVYEGLAGILAGCCVLALHRALISAARQPPAAADLPSNRPAARP